MTNPAAKFYCQCGQEVWAYIPKRRAAICFMVKNFSPLLDRNVVDIVRQCPSCGRKLDDTLKTEKPK